MSKREKVSSEILGDLKKTDRRLFRIAIYGLAPLFAFFIMLSIFFSTFITIPSYTFFIIQLSGYFGGIIMGLAVYGMTLAPLLERAKREA